MFTLQTTLRFVMLLVFIATVSSLARGTAFRTFVDVTGDDINTGTNCPHSAPCRTLGAAFGVTDAGGELIVLGTGGFSAINITKAITIAAAPGQLVLINAPSGSTGISVNAGAGDDVVLRGIHLNGSGSGGAGIVFNTGRALYIENCVVHAFAGIGIDFMSPGTAYLHVTDTIVRNCQTGGIRVQSSVGGNRANANIDNTRLERNGFGVKAFDNSTVNVRNSIASENSGVGFLSEITVGSSTLSLESCLASHNNIGVQMHYVSGASMRIELSNVTLFQNTTTAIQKAAPDVQPFFVIRSYGNNHFLDPGVIDETVPPQ